MSMTLRIRVAQGRVWVAGKQRAPVDVLGRVPLGKELTEGSWGLPAWGRGPSGGR